MQLHIHLDIPDTKLNNVCTRETETKMFEEIYQMVDRLQCSLYAMVKKHGGPPEGMAETVASETSCSVGNWEITE